MRLIREHQGALEYDLIALGLRLRWLGTEALTWHDLDVIVTYSPRSSAIVHVTEGEGAYWSLTDHFLALVIDVLNIANWQRGKPGSPRPKALPRPGDRKEPEFIEPTAMSWEDAEDFLGWSLPTDAPLQITQDPEEVD